MKKLTAIFLLTIMIACLAAAAATVSAADSDEAAYSTVFEDMRNNIRNDDYMITGRDGYPTNDISEVSYTFYDIDGNGVKELIFMTEGETCIIFTLVSGKGVQLAYWPGYRDCFVGINELGYMHGEGSSGAFSGSSDYYRISSDAKSGELVARIEYEYDPDGSDYAIYTVYTPQWARTMSESELDEFLATIQAPDIKLENWKTLTDQSGKVEAQTDFSGAIGGFETSVKSTYSEGIFSDVNENLWYGTNKQAVIKKAYELRIIEGKGGGIFDPGGNITIAEAIKMAAVVNNIYSGGDGSFDQGIPWYTVYVDYAISSGIIKSNAFNGNFSKFATRAEMASIFAGSVPESELKETIKVDRLPDVSENDLYGEAIFRLYRAGVLTGNDSQGTFNPNSNITRAEASAIISRIVLPQERIK